METIFSSLSHAYYVKMNQPKMDVKDPRSDPREYARFRAQQEVKREILNTKDPRNDPREYARFRALQEVKRKMLMRRYRTRNAFVGLGLTAGIIATYAYSMYAVKQETFLDKEFDQPAASSNS